MLWFKLCDTFQYSELHTPIRLQILTKKKGEKEEKAELNVLSKTNILRASFNNLHPVEYGTVKQNQDHLCPKAVPVERVTVSI